MLAGVLKRSSQYFFDPDKEPQWILAGSLNGPLEGSWMDPHMACFSWDDFYMGTQMTLIGPRHDLHDGFKQGATWISKTIVFSRENNHFGVFEVFISNSTLALPFNISSTCSWTASVYQQEHTRVELCCWKMEISKNWSRLFLQSRGERAEIARSTSFSVPTRRI